MYYGVDKNEVLQEGHAGEDAEAKRGPEEMEKPPVKWWLQKGKQKDEDRKKLSTGGGMVGEAGVELGESWIRVALGLREDLALK